MVKKSKLICRWPFICGVIFIAGCTSPKTANPAVGPKDTAITGLNVFAVPVGLNLDQIPGPDSFSVKVYAVNNVETKGVPIENGTLEVLAFDGSFFGRTNLPPVLRTWAYNSSQLERYKFRSHIGTGYEFTLQWGTNKPTHTLMSVAARYTGSEGQVVTSRPSSVTVIDK